MKLNHFFPWIKHASQGARQNDAQPKAERLGAAIEPTVLNSSELQQVSGGGATSMAALPTVSTASLPRGGGW